MSNNIVVKTHTENAQLGTLKLLANAVRRLKVLIPSVHLDNPKTLPMTTELYKKINKTDKTLKHCIDLSLMRLPDVKLLLEHFHDLDDTGKKTLTLFMRLTKREHPAMFELYKQWFPEKSLFSNFHSLNLKAERSLIGWDRKTMPYLHDWDLKAICLQFAELNSDHRNLLIEYINLFVALYPAEIYKLRNYLERRNPEHPLLNITALAQRELCSIRALRNKLESWDVSTVPYFSEDTLKDLAIHYDNWLIEEKKCFLKYITMLNEICPEQVHRLKEHLQITNPLNPLLKLSPLASFKNTTNNKPITDPQRSKKDCDKLETGKNELMDIGDSNLNQSHVKNDRFGANATVPQNKIKLNLIKSNLKCTKSKNGHFDAKLTQRIDAVINQETNQSTIILEKSAKPLQNEYLSLKQNDLNNQINQESDMKPDFTYNNFTLDDFL